MTGARTEAERLRGVPALPSTAQVTEYRLNLLPEGHPARRHYEVTVRRRSGKRDLWWVTARHTGALLDDGTWEHDVPLSPPDGWWDTRSWPHDEALRRADAALPTVEVMGKTARDVLAEREAGQ